jgi:hypothetical protein
MLERYSWACAPLIWGLSFLHSGSESSSSPESQMTYPIIVWWHYVGWSSRASPLCYYAPHYLSINIDARDLVQFIPRAFVFITICILYSTLFSFLRRPDTIQLSSEFVSGGVEQVDGLKTGRYTMKAFRSKRPSSASAAHAPGQTGSVNPDAPWEQLEFVQVGGSSLWLNSNSPVLSHMPQLSPTGRRSSGIPLYSGPVTPDSQDGDNLNLSLAVPDIRPGMSSKVSLASTSSLPDTPLSTRETDNLVLPEGQHATQNRRPSMMNRISHMSALSPVLSQYSAEENVDRDRGMTIPDDYMNAPEGSLRVVYDKGEGVGTRKTDEQTMKDFFKEFQVESPGEGGEGGIGGSEGKLGMPISATAYFNRQASLLMLYFPLAVSSANSSL